MKVEDALWQAHHILCNHSVAQTNIDAAFTSAGIDLTYGNDVVWITPWDLNDGHNMIGLPTNWQHRLNAGKDPLNLPSHQVDHNTKDGYTDECTKWLKKNVWNKVKEWGKSHDPTLGMYVSFWSWGPRVWGSNCRNAEFGPTERERLTAGLTVFRLHQKAHPLLKEPHTNRRTNGTSRSPWPTKTM